MGRVLGDILLYGLGIAVGPLPIFVAVLLLTGKRGHTKSVAYLIGWLLGLGLLVGFVIWFVGNYDFTEQGQPSLIMSWARILAGIALVVLAAVSWRRRPPRDAKPKLPNWLRFTHKAPAPLALGVGLFFGLVSLKNLILTAAAASSVARAQLDVSTATMCSILFIGVATLGVGAPVGAAFLNKQRANEILEGWVKWISANNTPIVCLLCLVVGVKLLWDGWVEL